MIFEEEYAADVEVAFNNEAARQALMRRLVAENPDADEEQIYAIWKEELLRDHDARGGRDRKLEPPQSSAPFAI